MTDETDILLAERGKTHGDFTEHAEVTQYLKDTMRSFAGWHRMTPAMKESADMIAHKLGRILAGTPAYNDHWDDIAGYARLVSLRITDDRKKRIKGKPVVAEVEDGKVTNITIKSS